MPPFPLRGLPVLAALGLILLVPARAAARTPCAGETATPNTLNTPKVSDAITCLTNQVRAHHGLPGLTRDGRLDVAASLHSLDMEVRSFFDHDNPDGRDPNARAQLQGYTLGAGENIAAGYRDAVHVMTGWMASTGHCENILGAARDIGVGTTAGGPTYTMVLGNYSLPEPSGPRNGCPYALDLAALTVARTPAATDATPTEDAPVTSGPAPDQAFTLTGLRVERRTVRAGRAASLRLTLSAPAKVTAKLSRRVKGRRSGSRCVKAARTGRRCTTWRSVRSRRSWRATAGANRLALSTKGLRGGRYRLVVTAKDLAGRTTKPRTVNLVLR